MSGCSSSRYLLVRPGPDPDLGYTPPWTFTFLLGWAGMRGVVTLAAAFVIPEEADHREILLLIAFTVGGRHPVPAGPHAAAGWRAGCEVPSPDPMDDALARATILQQASKAGFEELDRLEFEDPHGVGEMIRQRVDQRNFAAWERLGTVADQETPERALLPDPARDDRRRAPAGAGDPQPRHGRLRGDQRGAVDARRRGVDARASPTRSTTSCARSNARRRPRGEVVRRPRGAPGRRRPPADPVCQALPRRGHHAGSRCGSAWTAARSPAATPRRGSTPPRTSARPPTR